MAKKKKKESKKMVTSLKPILLKESVELAKPDCNKCWEFKQHGFSFGCMRGCKGFMKHIERISEMKGSPCTNYRCGVPEVSDKNRKLCEICPIREAYAQSLGKIHKGTRCKLGQNHVSYKTARDYPGQPMRRGENAL